MATRKTPSTRTPAAAPAATPATPAAVARPRRPGAPRRAKRASDDVPTALTVAPPTQEAIRMRAYHLSLERRGLTSDPVADWLRAEQELVAGLRLLENADGAGTPS